MKPSRSPIKINDHEPYVSIMKPEMKINDLGIVDHEPSVMIVDLEVIDHGRSGSRTSHASRLIYNDHARDLRVRAEWILKRRTPPKPPVGRPTRMSIAPSPTRHSLVYSSVPHKDAAGRWSPRYRGLCGCGFVTGEYTGRQRVFREHREHVTKIFESEAPVQRSRKLFRDY